MKFADVPGLEEEKKRLIDFFKRDLYMSLLVGCVRGVEEKSSGIRHVFQRQSHMPMRNPRS